MVSLELSLPVANMYAQTVTIDRAAVMPSIEVEVKGIEIAVTFVIQDYGGTVEPIRFPGFVRSHTIGPEWYLRRDVD